MEGNQKIKEDIEHLKKAITEKQGWLEWYQEKLRDTETELRSFEDSLTHLEDELKHQ